MKVFEVSGAFGIDNLSPAERPQPSPGHGEVLVKVRAVSLNYRDLLVVKGLYNPKLSLPFIPCSDGAGEVVATGDGVTRLKAGDRVAGIFMQKWISGELTEDKAKSALGGGLEGMLSEQVVLREDGLVPIPGHLSYEEAATLPCAAVTAWHAVVRSGLKPGTRVLVLGTGGVSLFALQFARLAGAEVIITSSSEEKLAKAAALGAAHGVHYPSFPEWGSKVRELTDGTGVDLVVEVGGAGTLPESLKAVRTGGEIALIGVLTGTGGTINPLPVVMKKIRMQGIFVGSREMFEEMNRAIGLHGFHPVLDRVFSLGETSEAFRYLESGAHFGKVCIKTG